MIEAKYKTWQRQISHEWQYCNPVLCNKLICHMAQPLDSLPGDFTCIHLTYVTLRYNIQWPLHGTRQKSSRDVEEHQCISCNGGCSATVVVLVTHLAKLLHIICGAARSLLLLLLSLVVFWESPRCVAVHDCSCEGVKAAALPQQLCRC